MRKGDATCKNCGVLLKVQAICDLP